MPSFRRGTNNVEYVEKLFETSKFVVESDTHAYLNNLPYEAYGSDGINTQQGAILLGVGLIANRDIFAGEELYSNYDEIVPLCRSTRTSTK